MNTPAIGIRAMKHNKRASRLIVAVTLSFIEISLVALGVGTSSVAAQVCNPAPNPRLSITGFPTGVTFPINSEVVIKGNSGTYCAWIATRNGLVPDLKALPHEWTVIEAPAPGAASYPRTYVSVSPPGPTSFSFTPAVAGVYVVRLTNNNGSAQIALTVVAEGPPTASRGWGREPANRLTNAPVAATNFDGRIYVFAKGTENRIWLQTYDYSNGSWLSTIVWTEVPSSGITEAAPAATSTRDTLYLFVKGMDNQVWVNKKARGGGPTDGWSGWYQELPRGETHVAVAATATKTGWVYVFRTGSDGNVYSSHRSQGSSWSAWTQVYSPAPYPTGYPVQNPPAAAYDEVTDTVFNLINIDNIEAGSGRSLALKGRIIISSFPAGAVKGSNWCGIDDPYTETKTAVAAAAGAGRLHLFYRGLDNRIYAQMYSGACGVWSGAADLVGMGSTDAAPAAAFVRIIPKVGPQFMVFAKGIGATGGIFYNFFSDPDIVPQVNTRGHFNTSTGNMNPSTTSIPINPDNYRTMGTIPGMTPGTTCPSEIGIAVHGFDNNPTAAQIRFQRARRSLRELGYAGPLVGFSWDSNTCEGDTCVGDLGNFDGEFWRADKIARGNGRKLAKFLDDYKGGCEATKIHLMGHSHGTRVILEALETLRTAGWNWTNAGWKVDDVHLLGAAVENSAPIITYNRAISSQTHKLHSYYSDSDLVLKILFGYAGGGALGLAPAGVFPPVGGSKPPNYTDVDVKHLMGSDHYGYWGYRTEDIGQKSGTLGIDIKWASIGAMGEVYRRWRRPEPLLQGYLDVVNCDLVAGWAWDKSYPDATINVDIYDGDDRIATVPANSLRPDLPGAGIGNGYHAFFFAVPADLINGKKHSISVKFSGTALNLGLSPKSLECLPSSYRGFLDFASCDGIRGRAWDQNRPQTTLNVDIYDGGRLLATVPANQPSQNPLPGNPGLGDQDPGKPVPGNHSFNFPIPAGLKDGRPHSISVKFSGTVFNLSNSPKTITCGPPRAVLTVQAICEGCATAPVQMAVSVTVSNPALGDRLTPFNFDVALGGQASLTAAATASAGGKSLQFKHWFSVTDNRVIGANRTLSGTANKTETLAAVYRVAQAPLATLRVETRLGNGNALANVPIMVIVPCQVQGGCRPSANPDGSFQLTLNAGATAQLRAPRYSNGSEQCNLTVCPPRFARWRVGAQTLTTDQTVNIVVNQNTTVVAEYQ